VEWKVRTFQAILSDVGGYQAILISSIAFLISGYSSWKYQTSIMKKFYLERDIEDSDKSARLSDIDEMELRINKSKGYMYSYF